MTPTLAVISLMMNKLQGLSEAKVDKIKEVLQKLLGSQFKTAFDVSELRKSIFRISTGCEDFE